MDINLDLVQPPDFSANIIFMKAMMSKKFAPPKKKQKTSIVTDTTLFALTYSKNNYQAKAQSVGAKNRLHFEITRALFDLVSMSLHTDV